LTIRKNDDNDDNDKNTSDCWNLVDDSKYINNVDDDNDDYDDDNNNDNVNNDKNANDGWNLVDDSRRHNDKDESIESVTIFSRAYCQIKKERKNYFVRLFTSNIALHILFEG
jgi:hypothetical protein